MLNKLRDFLRQYSMVRPGDRIIVAVSGGADSVALLFGLYLLKEELSIELEAAHFNHQLRGAESDRDAEFVRSFCAGYGIPLHEAGGRILPGEKGLEAAARDARYKFLRSLPGQIATAHTADDNAETVLLHLIRGTGLKGLGAIAPVSGNVIRPMLSVTRREVEQFLEEYSLTHVEDSSNASDAFLRNRIRHHIMPPLREENPRIAESVSAMALRLRDDEAFISAGLAAELPEVSCLTQMHPARRRRYLEGFLKRSGVREPEQTHIAQAEALVFHSNPSAAMDFPGGVVICRQYDRLIALREKPEALPVRRLACPGRTEIPELGLVAECFPAEAIVQSADVLTVVPEGALVLRSRQTGDEIRLSGGRRSLKKLFIDRKIPAVQRCRIPVVSDDAGILGVYGIGADLDRQAAALPAVCIRFQSISNGTSDSTVRDNGADSSDSVE